MGLLEGKIALVTGAARGIGRGIALRLAGEGADIVVNDLPRERRPAPVGDGGEAASKEAAAVAAEIEALGRAALLAPGDVADPAQVADIFAAAVGRFGRVDVVVANAGLVFRNRVVDAHVEAVRRMVDVVGLGTFFTVQAAARQMLAQAQAKAPGGPEGAAAGKIVVIGSVHAHATMPGHGAYAMCKAGINQLARVLAAELAPHRINVNVLNPGWVDTPGERTHFGDGVIENAGQELPWGRIGQPADVASAVAFLCSEEADYISGAAITLDAAFTLSGSGPGEG